MGWAILKIYLEGTASRKNVIPVVINLGYEYSRGYAKLREKIVINTE
jgi:hypothetical protein